MREIITIMGFVLAFVTGSTTTFGQLPNSGQVSIDPATIPQFVDPLPHFAGKRVNATAGGQIILKTVPTTQVALSTGTVLDNGIVGTDPGAGIGRYWAYTISKDNGATWTPALWPAVTIEARRNRPLDVVMRNGLDGETYASVGLTVDQSIMWASPMVTGNTMMDSYSGPVPMSVHLHGGEVPSASDGGPLSWFTPNYEMKGPSFAQGVDSIYHYPNSQEAATLWFHEHSMGATRLNVYAGLAGFYFLRGEEEKTDKLPGFPGDDLVKEVKPAWASGTFNPNPYLAEIEIAIQDRMFDTKGNLYWPNTPPNPDLHPFWTPEFFGDVITVNGKSWPYLSVAPRKYRFHVLDGSNARFYELWLQNLQTGAMGPVIRQVGTDGGLLDAPVVLDPATGARLFLAPGERADIVIDFSGLPAGTVVTLMNSANAPYPTGDPVSVGTTDRIMQFVVNGQMVSAEHPNRPGIDKSRVPAVLREKPLVRLTDFAGVTNVPIDKKRQLVLNEVEGIGGPEMVLVNNSRYDSTAAAMSMNPQFGALTEKPVEGTTELWQIINTTMDAHPIHVHLAQFQLVSRQAFNVDAYLKAYGTGFAGGMLMPGAGPPFAYDTLNSDNAVGGNPAITQFLTGPVIPADANEKGWKDTYKSYPGQIMTFIVRFAPTTLKTNAPKRQLLYGFDPSVGPGYVWHCHIIDHEDNEMMRPYRVTASAYRIDLKESPAIPIVVAAADGYNLEQNYPNPVVSSTRISYSVPKATHVIMKLYNQTGAVIQTLVDEIAEAGSHTISFDPGRLTNGIYYYNFIADDFTATKKLILVKD